MSSFRYVAQYEGMEVRGILEADRKSAAVAELKRQGLNCISVRRHGRTTGQFLRRLFEIT